MLNKHFACGGRAYASPGFHLKKAKELFNNCEQWTSLWMKVISMETAGRWTVPSRVQQRWLGVRY